jgi:hypothetical protein
MTARCFSLMPIVTFRFWQVSNGHRNLLCGVIIFGMRDLSVMTHDMFENEFGLIPSSAMCFIWSQSGPGVRAVPFYFGFWRRMVSHIADRGSLEGFWQCYSPISREITSFFSQRDQ